MYNKQNKEKSALTLKEERFCQLFATDREFFGNGVQSYIEAYGVNLSKKGAYNVAGVEAHGLLRKPKIYNRINALLEEGGLNDVAVDKQLSYVIHQQDDVRAKLSGINEYNKLKGRHAAQKIKFVDENQDLNDEEINDAINQAKGAKP